MQVLLSPMKFALQHSNSQAVRLAAVGSWARLMLLLLGQRQLLPLLDHPAAVAGAAGAGAGTLVNNGVLHSLAGGLQDGPLPPQQQQQTAGCEGLSLQALQGFLRPMVETILGSTGEAAAAAAAAAGRGGGNACGGSGRSKQQQQDGGSSCLAATPVVQFVLQQVVYTLSAAASARGEQQQQQQQQQEGTQLSALLLLLCRLMQTAVCACADAVSIKAAAAAAAAAATAVGAGVVLPAAEDACTTPGAAAEAGADTPKGSVVSPEQAAAAAACREVTPCTPAHGKLVSVPGGLWGSALKQQGGQGPGSAFKQGMGWLQLVTPPVNSRLTPPVAAAAVAAAATTPGAAAGGSPNGVVGVVADPVRVLQNLPGWLQLLLEMLHLLLLPVPGSQGEACAAGSEGSGEQQLQLVQREWLPAWVGAMDQMGAAVLLLLQQRSHAHSNSGSSGSRSLKQQQQQQLVTVAVGATVQGVLALQECMKVSSVLCG
jgi:hypothetical protein